MTGTGRQAKLPGMKRPVGGVNHYLFIESKRAVWLAILLVLRLGPQAVAAERPAADPEYRPTADEFSVLANAALELLQSGATARFAGTVAPSLDDWKSIL